MNFGDESVWGGSPDCAGLSDIALCAHPRFPESGKGENRVIRHADAERLFGFWADRLPPIERVRRRSASRNAGLSAAVSDIALMVFVAIDGSFAQEGIRPQRTRSNERRVVVLFCRMIGTSCVGCDVPARRPGWIFIQSEVIPEVAFFRGESITSSHDDYLCTN